jgi:pyridoxine kinase
MRRPSTPRAANVLSIQSHVVHGYVGNKAAVLPLQLLGIDVAPLNSVHFSNHTGYANGFKGTVLDGDALLALVSGLEENGLLAGFTHLLTGYIGSESFLRAVLEVRRRIAAARGGNAPMWVCDPVLGDHGKLYVPPSLVEVYRTDVVGLASVLTPNHFECEQLSGVTITDRASALTACDVLHAKGARTVVVTSATYRVEGSDDVLRVLGSRDGTAFEIDVACVDGCYTGTGDMVAALTLAWLHRSTVSAPTTASAPAVATPAREEEDGDLALAMENAIATVQAVIARTPAGAELRLVESRFDIMDPPERFWRAARVVRAP